LSPQPVSCDPGATVWPATPSRGSPLERAARVRLSLGKGLPTTTSLRFRQSAQPRPDDRPLSANTATRLLETRFPKPSGFSPGLQESLSLNAQPEIACNADRASWTLSRCSAKEKGELKSLFDPIPPESSKA